jgi:hypothetical protein
VNEKAGTVPGIKMLDLSSWWAQVVSHFDDGIAPGIEEQVVVPYESVSVLALFMDTTGAPYVVKTGDEKVSRELPWRLSTGVRSAQRADIVKLVSPLVSLPEFEIVWSEVSVRWVTKDDKKAVRRWRLAARLYVTPWGRRDDRVPTTSHISPDRTWRQPKERNRAP